MVDDFEVVPAHFPGDTGQKYKTSQCSGLGGGMKAGPPKPEVGVPAAGRQKGRAMYGRQKAFKTLLAAPNLPSKQVQRWHCILLTDRTCNMKVKCSTNRR